jgi:hypothetical protein
MIGYNSGVLAKLDNSLAFMKPESSLPCSQQHADLIQNRNIHRHENPSYHTVRSSSRPGDGSKHLWNVGHLRDCTAQYPHRRQPSSQKWFQNLFLPGNETILQISQLHTFSVPKKTGLIVWRNGHTHRYIVVSINCIRHSPNFLYAVNFVAIIM